MASQGRGDDEGAGAQVDGDMRGDIEGERTMVVVTRSMEEGTLKRKEGRKICEWLKRRSWRAACLWGVSAN